jgi:hypothetical protein
MARFGYIGRNSARNSADKPQYSAPRSLSWTMRRQRVQKSEKYHSFAGAVSLTSWDAPHGKKQDAVDDRRVSELRAETRSQNLTHRARGQEASLELLGAGVGRRYARPTSPRRAHPTMLVEGGRRDAASV